MRTEKVISIPGAVSKVKDGDTIMFGGFLSDGAALQLIDALVSADRKNLTLIANDTSFPDKGIGQLIVHHQVKKVMASHIGTNKETGRQMNAQEIEVELIPQGTLAERIRAAGFGLGGVLTPTGIGTLVEDGKQKIEIDGNEFLLEKPLKADFAFIFAEKADTFGNLVYKGSANNFNHVMATAANTTIVEVETLLDCGEIDPNEVVTPGIFVDFIVKRGDARG
ncbi:MAG: CoA transferase subunit A [Streptococcaceae bacterium]|jgi:acetate CoA/acetoacetate CoA-transferase alpha subunit|nr:CoA transferase subunit A [Streptococcaceae bacterium]